MERTLIDHKTPEAELIKSGEELGEKVKACLDRGQYDHAACCFIECGLIENLYFMSSIMTKSLDDVCLDRMEVVKFHRMRHVCELYFHASKHWVDYLRPDIALDVAFTPAKRQEIIEQVAKDIYLICVWSIFSGADARSFREHITSRDQQYVNKALKRVGIGGILSHALRGCVVLMTLDDKVFKPAIEAHKEKYLRGIDTARVNTMAAAINSAKLKR